MTDLPTTARPCPPWCAGEHTIHAFGVTHHGADGKVVTHLTPSGNELDYIVVTPDHLIPNTDAPDWLANAGPQVTLWGSAGAGIMSLPLDEAERLARLQRQLGNIELADVLHRTVESVRQSGPTVPGTYPDGEPQSVRAAAERNGGVR